MIARNRMFLLLLGMLLLPATRAAAQAWDAPYFVPPGPKPGLGIYLMDVSGGGVGVMGAWRSSTGSYGLRGGIADEPAGDIGVFGGVDFAGNITRANVDFPLDVDWVFGAGLGASDGVFVSVPLGLTLGHTFHDPSASFTPYLTPRVSLDAAFAHGDSNADLGLSVDVGIDVRFTPRFLIRFGASMGDRDAVGIGLVF